MTTSKIGKKKSLKKPQTIHRCFAMRSQNEIYYQMASIFKAVTKDEDELTEKMLGTLMGMKNSDFFVDNKI